MNITLDSVVGLIAPHQCLACGAEGSLLCDECLITAGDLMAPRCAGCYKLSEKSKTCKTCKKWLVVDSISVSTVYEGIYEKLLFAMKFDNKRQASVSIAKIMSEAGLDVAEDSILCPVPTAPARIRQRGFDHTSLIASELSKILDLKNYSLLSRNTNTRQFGATRANRLKQMENEFYLRPKSKVDGKNIVLIDDVMTTGATLSSCAKVLKKSGAKSVKALIFAQKV